MRGHLHIAKLIFASDVEYTVVSGSQSFLEIHSHLTVVLIPVEAYSLYPNLQLKKIESHII